MEQADDGEAKLTVGQDAKFKIGDVIEAHSLVNGALLNGLRGKVFALLGERVGVDFGHPHGSKALLPEKIRKISIAEPTSFEGGIAEDQINNPAAIPDLMYSSESELDVDKESEDSDSDSDVDISNFSLWGLVDNGRLCSSYLEHSANASKNRVATRDR